MKKLLVFIAVIVALALVAVPVDAKKEKWVCKPGWSNWKHAKIKHDAYTTHTPMFIGKSLIMMPVYHDSWTENKWTCLNWIKEKDLHKYDKNGKLKKKESQGEK